jgi:hypothetical protein
MAQTVGGAVGRIEEGQRREEETAYQRKQQQAQMDFQREVATSQAAQQQQKIDLQMAESGFQRGEGGPESPLLTDRQKALEAEMGQGAQETGAPPEDPAAEQRLQEQMGKPLGDSPYITPTPERQQAQAFKRSNEQQKREIERANAASRMRNAVTAHRKAVFTKDKEGMAKARKDLQFGVEKASDALDDVMNGKPINGASLAHLLRETQGHPVNDMLKNASTMDDPTMVIEHLKNQVTMNTLKFALQIGEIPDSKYVNWAAPKMQIFAGNIGWVNDMMKVTGMGGYRGFSSGEERNRIVMSIAAGKTLQGLAQPPKSPNNQLPGNLPPGPEEPSADERIRSGYESDKEDILHSRLRLERGNRPEDLPPPPEPTEFAR